MERIREELKEVAVLHFQQLSRVAPTIRSLLFSRSRSDQVYPFGSFVNGTFTGQSDIDLYLQDDSKQYGSGYSRAMNLSQHLKKNHGIESRVTGNILFFTYQGVQINAVVGKPHKIVTSQTRDKLISSIVARFPLYCDVVRFFKVFGDTYIERFPNGKDSKPVCPGSHFYTIVSSIALNLLTEQRTVKRSMQALSFKDAVLVVANFIGSEEYMKHASTLTHFEVDPAVKFASTKAREEFNKYFRALAVHITTGIPLPKFNVREVSSFKPSVPLHSLSKSTEEKRERDMKGKRTTEATKITQAKAVPHKSYFNTPYEEVDGWHDNYISSLVDPDYDLK